MHITVIGKNSFLGQALAAHSQAQLWRFLSHEEALSDTALLADTDILFNLAYHPCIKKTAYAVGYDFDQTLAHIIKDHHHIHYTMASSRAIYGPAPEGLMLSENDAINPNTVYGRNKATTERAVIDILGTERVTILRMGNIFGAEYGRSSFFGHMLTRLLEEGLMRFDIAPDARRDFISARYWAACIANILPQKNAGVYNLASGIGTTTDEIAQSLIAIAGKGRAIYTDQSYAGSFILNMENTYKVFNLPAYSADQFHMDIKDAWTHTLLQHSDIKNIKFS